jgi:hypothetical protein
MEKEKNGMRTSRILPETRKKFQALSTPTISDALNRLGFSGGAMGFNLSFQE